MILGPISLLDCLVFLIFLTPRLIIDVGLFKTLQCVFQALPFLVLQMPVQLIHERYLLRSTRQSPFVQHASLFQDLVIRCVRYAFARIPATIGAVFFSKAVSVPFMRFRMLRHGHLRSPMHYKEVSRPGMHGIWIIDDPEEDPDIVVLYCHGGGFSMGSSFFYLEFLMSWMELLRTRGKFTNPAVFALEYTLVPTAVFPTQLHETRKAYDFVLEKVKAHDPSRICVAGDSAGATLSLSLLLSLAESANEHRTPGFATLISPWCVLVSDKDRDTPSDYLNVDSLHLYARQYVGATGLMEDGQPDGQKQRETTINHPLASPGNCKDMAWWKRAAPKYGYNFVFGSEEVFAPNAKELIKSLRTLGSTVDVTESMGGIHAWPVVQLFLKDSREDRLAGLMEIVDSMTLRMRR